MTTSNNYIYFYIKVKRGFLEVLLHTETKSPSAGVAGALVFILISEI